jgi:hypothetical protein
MLLAAVKVLHTLAQSTIESVQALRSIRRHPEAFHRRDGLAATVVNLEPNLRCQRIRLP